MKDTIVIASCRREIKRLKAEIKFYERLRPIAPERADLNIAPFKAQLAAKEAQLKQELKGY